MKYGMTSHLLYTLAQLGFKVDILKYGMNVVMDVVNLSVELCDKGAGEDEELYDLAAPMTLEG